VRSEKKTGSNNYDKPEAHKVDIHHQATADHSSFDERKQITLERSFRSGSSNLFQIFCQSFCNNRSFTRSLGIGSPAFAPLLVMRLEAAALFVLSGVSEF
jgi:hypothetical protein